MGSKEYQARWDSGFREKPRAMLCLISDRLSLQFSIACSGCLIGCQANSTG